MEKKIALQHKILTGYAILVAVIGSMAATLLHERNRVFEIETEMRRLNLVQRDVNTAHRYITRLAMRGETAKMAAIKRLSDQPYRVETEMVDVTKVANFEKKVPADWITEDGMHVNEKFERYARPLIQAELSPIYINGVPRHIHL